MPEPTKFSLADARLADNTVDFYVLLGEEPDTPEDLLKAKIQTLYAESQANRDHRNLTKRREYQTMLELLPWARAALLDVEKRQRYNAYLAAAKSGTNSPDFETFINDLMGVNEQMEEKTGLLGVQEQTKVAQARVIKTTTPASAASKSAPAPKSAKPAIPPAALGGAVGGFILGIVIWALFLSAKSIAVGILLGVILGAFAFVLLNRKPGRKIGV